MSARRELTLAAYADLLVTVLGRNAIARRAASLLRGDVPDEEAAALDAHARALRAHLGAIAAALSALPEPAATSLCQLDATAAGQALPQMDVDQTVDELAGWLLGRLASWPGHGHRLAVATGRLLEESAALQPEARRTLPLGRGFEALFHERLLRRVALLPERSGHLLVLRRNWRLLLEEPEQAAVEIERDLGAPLTAEERAWLEVERRAGTLRFVRKNKTEEGHIRWFVRPDSRHGAVLDRLGVRGHWIVYGDQCQTDLARLGTAVERVVPAQGSLPGSAWRVVAAGGSDQRGGDAWLAPVEAAYVVPPATAAEQDLTALRARLRQALAAADPASAGGHVRDALATATASSSAATAHPRPARACALRDSEAGLSLVAIGHDGAGGEVLAHVAHQAGEDELLAFLDAVDCVADVAPPIDETRRRHGESPPLAWTRALLRVREPARAAPRCHDGIAGLRVRLVSVPSSIPHQFGGMPLLGLDFLRERLERLGARVNVLSIAPTDLRRRLPELLGADVVGIGVYVHNRRQVAELIAMLRRSGYAGKVVLGGPELRNIDLIQSSIDGWDALIRGEAEDVLPQVLRLLGDLDAGRWAQGLAVASALRGVAIRHGRALLLCDTAGRNRAEAITCPLPFDWMRGRSRRRLQMNFTRGCPYRCAFCPNHQGRRFRSAYADELWRYTVLAVADDLSLPAATRDRIAGWIQGELRVATAPSLRVALHVLLRAGADAGRVRALCAPLADLIEPRVAADAAVLDDLVGMRETLDERLRALGDGDVPAWQVKETWLIAKLAVLASRQLRRRGGRRHRRLEPIGWAAKPAFVLETSEDNTLVNRQAIIEYVRRRRHYGLDEDFIFNPGQNTIWDLTDKKGNADEAYIAALVDRNPFAVALGVDGPSNPVIRQNRKPFYRVSEVMAVNRALARHQVRVANNYILLTPETDLLEAVEAFALFLLLPLPWRDYGAGINLRVVKEETTLSRDEGLLFAPGDTGFNEPMRFAEVQRLLDRWSLTPLLGSGDLEPLLWRMFRGDPQVAPLLPMVVARWLRDFDADPELVALGRLIASESRPDVPLVETLRTVKRHLAEEFRVMAQQPQSSSVGWV